LTACASVASSRSMTVIVVLSATPKASPLLPDVDRRRAEAASAHREAVLSGDAGRVERCVGGVDGEGGPSPFSMKMESGPLSVSSFLILNLNKICVAFGYSYQSVIFQHISNCDWNTSRGDSHLISTLRPCIRFLSGEKNVTHLAIFSEFPQAATACELPNTYDTIYFNLRFVSRTNLPDMQVPRTVRIGF
jgi:hypothetical protein